MSDLELALRSLGARLDDQPVGDLSLDVASALQPRARGRVRRRRRAIAIAMAALLLASGSVLAASSELRDQARSWLRSVGISASLSDRAATAPLATIDRAGLGQPITAAAAASRLSLRALPLPFGSGARVFAVGRAVTVVWGPAADRPPSTVRGIGALLTIARQTGTDDQFVLAKELSRTSQVEFVSLAQADGGRALWISGTPHAVRGFGGAVLRFRLAANVLIWRVGALVYRLEGRLKRSVAIEAARRAMTEWRR